MHGKQIKPNREISKRPVVFKFIDKTSEEIGVPIQDSLDIPPIGMFTPIPEELCNDETAPVSDIRDCKRSRCMQTDDVPSEDTPILIMDSAADISCIG